MKRRNFLFYLPFLWFLKKFQFIQPSATGIRHYAYATRYLTLVNLGAVRLPEPLTKEQKEWIENGTIRSGCCPARRMKITKNAN